MEAKDSQALVVGSIPTTRLQETPANSGVAGTGSESRSAFRSAPPSRIDRFVGGHATKTMLIAAVAVCITLLAVSLPAHSTTTLHGPRRGTPAYCRLHAASEYAARVCTVRVMWPTPLRAKALSVAACESGFNPNARNGQYQGTYQLGSRERRTYGHGSTVEAQTRAAIRLQHDRGWQPWACA